MLAPVRVLPRRRDHRRLPGQGADGAIRVSGKIVVVVEGGIDQAQGNKKKYDGGEPVGGSGKLVTGGGVEQDEWSFTK